MDPAVAAALGGRQAGQPPAANGLDPAVANALKGQLVELYETVSGKPTRVVAVTGESGMWRLVFEMDTPDKKSQQVVYATADGRRFFEGQGVHLRSELATVKRDKRFALCLADKKVRVFGDARGKTTVQQLRTIGRFGASLFINCATNPKNCAKLGVKSLPTVAVGNDMTPGVQTRAFLESATGCK